MTLSTDQAMLLGIAALGVDRSKLPQMRAEAEAKVPGTAFMGEVIARALGGLTVDGTIDMVLGIKITAAIADAVIAIHAEGARDNPTTLDDTLSDIKVAYQEENDTAEGARSEAAR